MRVSAVTECVGPRLVVGMGTNILVDTVRCAWFSFGYPVVLQIGWLSDHLSASGVQRVVLCSVYAARLCNVPGSGVVARVV